MMSLVEIRRVLSYYLAATLTSEEGVMQTAAHEEIPRYRRNLITVLCQSVVYGGNRTLV